MWLLHYCYTDFSDLTLLAQAFISGHPWLQQAETDKVQDNLPIINNSSGFLYLFSKNCSLPFRSEVITKETLATLIFTQLKSSI